MAKKINTYLRKTAMCKGIKASLALTVILLNMVVCRATHIVGGEMTYTYQGSNNYLVRLDLYIDCLNGNPDAIAQDATAFIGVFDGINGNILSGYPVEVPRKGPQKIVKLNYNCIKTAPNACVDHYWYEVVLNLPPRTGGYILSFQRCCRNNSITNLNAPESTGANYWTQIPDSRTLPDKKPNSSAVFKELPPNFLCTNYELKFDHSAKDPDGDSLAYDLFWPYDGANQSEPRPDNAGNGTLATPPFPNVTYASGYDYTNPIDGNPPLNIDDQTGLLTLYPTVEGQFVVGIRVREYRKGVLISETKRDYQFNVSSCVIDVVAAYYAPKYICGYTYKFTNKSSGATRYHWDFGFTGVTNDTSSQAFPTVTFPGPGRYFVTLIAYKNNCKDSFGQWITVVKPNIPHLPADTVVCKGRTITLTSDINGDSYLWSTGSSAKTITVGKQGLYWIQVTINTCAWRDSIKLDVDAQKVLATGDTLYCSNSTFNRSISSSAGMASYQWSTGESTPSINVTKPGDYIVEAKTIHGCVSYDTVKIRQYSPVVVKLRDTMVCPGRPVFVNALNYDAEKLWSTGDTTSNISISNPGMYWVKVTRGSCSNNDTMVLANFVNEFELGNDLRFCDHIDTFLTIRNTGFTNIVWNNEVTGSTYHLTKNGWVRVVLQNSHGCPETDSIQIALFPNPSLGLGDDTLVCLSINPVLSAPPGMVSYKWQDNSDKQTLTAYDTGLYWVEIKDKEGCRSRDSVFIHKSPDLYPSQVYMPNAFTPDGNGRNDLYPLNKYVNIGTLYNVRLYNRWGEKIADYDSPDFNWDGTIHGNPAPEGVYVFMVNWIGCDNKFHSLRGSFHLLR